MSQPPKQSGRGIGEVERQERAAKHKRKREEHLGYTNIVGSINAVTNQLAANEEAQDESERKRGFREKVTIVLVLLAFVAAAIGDIIFYCTMKDAQQANWPYVWLIPGDSVFRWKPTGEPGKGVVAITFQYRNYGKTVAAHEEMDAYVDLRGRGTSDFYLANVSGPIVMPPDYSATATVFSTTSITKQEFDDLARRNFTMILHVKMAYRDTYGGNHTSVICIMHMVNDGSLYCPGTSMK